MTKKSERQPIKAENVAGGAGYILKEELIKGEQLGAYCKMFNEVTLKPGCEIGYHEHHGETETYYLTKGAGIYNDNGKEYPVEVGDVTFCARRKWTWHQECGGRRSCVCGAYFERIV